MEDVSSFKLPQCSTLRHTNSQVTIQSMYMTTFLQKEIDTLSTTFSQCKNVCLRIQLYSYAHKYTNTM